MPSYAIQRPIPYIPNTNSHEINSINHSSEINHHRVTCRTSMAYFVFAGLRSESCQPDVLPSIDVSSKLDLQTKGNQKTQKHHTTQNDKQARHTTSRRHEHSTNHHQLVNTHDHAALACEPLPIDTRRLTTQLATYNTPAT